MRSTGQYSSLRVVSFDWTARFAVRPDLTILLGGLDVFCRDVIRMLELRRQYRLVADMMDWMDNRHCGTQQWGKGGDWPRVRRR